MYILWKEYNGSLNDLIKHAFKWYASPKIIENIKEELWRRSDIFCNDWYSGVFERFVGAYRDIDFFPDPTPRLRYPEPPRPYVILGGFYGWDGDQCTLLAVGILDVEHATLMAYDKDANIIHSSGEMCNDHPARE